MNDDLFIQKESEMPKSKKQCEEIKEQTKQKILEKSILYFSRNGFSGTKISDLCQFIGIAPGSIYNYFESKEELYDEIRKIAKTFDIDPMKNLLKLPFDARTKILYLSKYIITQLESNQMFAAQIALGTQDALEKNQNHASHLPYELEVYTLLHTLIEKGQSEGTVVSGDVLKLVDYYWSVVYLYALKKLFTGNELMIRSDDLARIVLKDPTNK